MPNWCYSDIYIHGKSEKNIKTFKEKIEEATKANPSCWWSEVIEHFGVDPNPFNCRGTILYITDVMYHDANKEYFVKMGAEDAWAPKADDTIPVLLEATGIAGEAEFCYVANESGCGIYMNTDESRTWLPWDFWVEGELETPWDGMDWGEYYTRKELIGLINRLGHKDYCCSISDEKLVEAIQDIRNNYVGSAMTNDYFVVERLVKE